MNTMEVIPDPTSLINSMRAVGYTAESAIADLVDNSISAGASRIDIEYDATGHPYIAILDDGKGMTPSEITEAMKHGSTDPTKARHSSDLGRFGLGLKTASLSQCKRLTVISKKNGIVSARRWDLDVVRETNRWLVVVPDDRDVASMPMADRLLSMKAGTLVVWQELDRLVAGASNAGAEMTTKLAPLLEHLALVFHRFTQREGANDPITMKINGQPVPARDPYLRHNTFGQPLEGQTLRYPEGTVQVTPHVLPPISKMTHDEIALAGGKDGLRGTQGFYVYRSRRLVIWGSWFRLVPKDEFFKLTRVQVDIPNSFDDLWALDIKKSVAYPPDSIRNRLKELIPHFATASKRTITYTGRLPSNPHYIPLWQRREISRNTFRYELNAEHPVLAALSSLLEQDRQRKLQAALTLIAEALPLEAIYADMCSDKRTPNEQLLPQLVELANQLIQVTGCSPRDAMNIDPLVRYPELHEALIREVTRDA